MIFKKIKVKEDDIFNNKLELAEKSREIFKSSSAFSAYPFIGALISIMLFVGLIMITKGSGMVVLALLLWYLLTNIIIAYFNTAVAACTRISGSGKKAGFSDGIKEANKRFSLIVNLGFLNTFGGLFMGTLSDIKLTKKYSGEFQWGLVASFIIPSMTFENKNIGMAIDDSQKLIKKSWGKNANGEYKLAFISFVPFLIVLILLIFSSVLKDEFVTYSLFVLTIFVLIAGMLINFTLRTIFYSTLYLNIKGKSK
jgi:hypothetical protein